MNKSPKGFNIVQVNSTDQIAVLYNTNIVKSFGRDLVLNSGGWLTNHTKKCMNIFLSPFNARVFQKKGEWFVSFLNEYCTEETVSFQDGMTIRVGV
jgi:hypothetical protein